MKRKELILIIGLSLIMLVFTGCDKKKEEVEKINDDRATNIIEEPPREIDIGEEDKEEREKIIEEFRELLEDTPSPSDLIKYIDRNIDKVSPIDGDEMIEALEKSLEDSRLVYENRLFELDKANELMEISGEDFEFNRSSIDDIKNKELKKLVNELYYNMYKLENLEGAFYPIIDYGKLKTYKDHITEEWKDYLMIKSLDSDNRTMSDGSLNISFDKLADRILKTENYLNKYINGQRQEEMLENYENKIYAYMKGLPNTPLGDRDTGEIYDEVVESYKKIADKEGYISSYMIYEYLEYIKANGYIIDEGVLEKADSLIIETLRMLREFK